MKRSVQETRKWAEKDEEERAGNEEVDNFRSVVFRCI